MKPSISIIVPIYNVELYLPSCLNSILTQTFTNFEVILINDGSDDNCQKICEAYRKKDQRIKVIHQKNQGVSSARNAGIKIAKGTYIAFVDPDDVILPEMYEVLMEKSLKYNADVTVCQYTQKNEINKTEKVPQIWQQSNDVVQHKTIMNEIFPNILVNNTFSLIPCFNKLYKKSIFDTYQIRFDELKSFGEDKQLNLEILPKISTLVFIEQPLYVYFKRQGESLSQVFRKDFYRYLLSDKKFLIDICKKYYLRRYINIVNELFITKVLVYAQDVIMNNEISENNKNKILLEIINDKDFKQNIKKYKANSLYYKILKHLCIWNNKKYLIKVIQWRNKIKMKNAG